MANVSNGTVGRGSNGRFVAGNKVSIEGGRARASKLTPARRREIASQGFAAMCNNQFGGDREAAAVWLTKKGQAALERIAYEDSPIYKPNVWRDPGPMPGVKRA